MNDPFQRTYQEAFSHIAPSQAALNRLKSGEKNNRFSALKRRRLAAISGLAAAIALTATLGVWAAGDKLTFPDSRFATSKPGKNPSLSGQSPVVPSDSDSHSPTNGQLSGDMAPMLYHNGQFYDLTSLPATPSLAGEQLGVTIGVGCLDWKHMEEEGASTLGTGVPYYAIAGIEADYRILSVSTDEKGKTEARIWENKSSRHITSVEQLLLEDGQSTALQSATLLSSWDLSPLQPLEPSAIIQDFWQTLLQAPRNYTDWHTYYENEYWKPGGEETVSERQLAVTLADGNSRQLRLLENGDVLLEGYIFTLRNAAFEQMWAMLGAYPDVLMESYMS